MEDFKWFSQSVIIKIEKKGGGNSYDISTILFRDHDYDWE